MIVAAKPCDCCREWGTCAHTGARWLCRTCFVAEFGRWPGDAEVGQRITYEDRGHTTPCWIWNGARSDTGYGNVEVSRGAREVHNVHALMYRLFKGSPSAGLQLDHLCRVRECCNPEHLEPVTPAENMRRAAALQTHCKHGHPLTPDNLYVVSTRPGARICKACHKRRTDARRTPERRHTGSCSQCGGPCLPTAQRCQACVRGEAA